MDRKRDILIFSAFGRGNWIASELAQKLKLKVTLVDVSKYLGHWGPEDWEGPFGLFGSQNLSNSQMERLEAEDYSDPVDEGFTLWLDKGPLELNGSLTSYLLPRFEIGSEVQEYIKDFDNLGEEKKGELIRFFQRRDFQSVWFVHLAHQIASTHFSPNAQSFEQGRPLPLFSPYFLRRVTRRGFEKSLHWCADQGVQVIRNARIKDIQVKRQRCEGIEIENGFAGLVRAEKLVWMLTSEETDFFHSSFSKVFFSKGVIYSKWTWVRFRIQVPERTLFKSLPLKFVMIEKLSLPWTHSNLCFVEKTVRDQDFDIWLRIPSFQRFQKAYLKNLSQEFLGILEKRIAGLKLKILNMPQDHLYNYEQLGPPRYPVFNWRELESLRNGLKGFRRMKNVYFDGPEHWPNLDWTGRFEVQNQLYEKIKKWALEKEKGHSFG